MARLLSLALIIGLLPSGLAGPACAQKFKSASDCISKCNSKWGFPGSMMGMDPWGTIMHQAGSTDEEWNAYIAQACGEQVNATATGDASYTTSSATEEATQLVKGLETEAPTSTTAASSTTTSTSSTHSSSSSRFTTSTTTSHTTTSTSSTPKPTTTSTSTKPKTTTTQTPATTHTTAQAPKATEQAAQTTQQAAQNTQSSSSSGGSSGSDASAADQQTYLDAHNTIRAQHGAVPVTWSNAAAAAAQDWASKCTNTHSGGTLGPFGENLAAGTGDFSITDAITAWTNEVSEYNPSDPVASHFTQVVWKATTEIGCAVATCDGIFSGFGAAQYYVCEYTVQGNVEGEFGTNVQV